MGTTFMVTILFPPGDVHVEDTINLQIEGILTSKVDLVQRNPRMRSLDRIPVVMVDNFNTDVSSAENEGTYNGVVQTTVVRVVDRAIRAG